MLDVRIRRFVPALLVLLVTCPALGDEPEPRPRPPIVLPDDGPPPWGARGVVFLHVETRAPRLEMRVFDGAWTTGPRGARRTFSRRVCAAPCDRIIDAREGARYFFSGPDLVSSDYFRLNDRAGPVTARVTVGSRRLRTSALIAGALGLLSVFGGSVLLGVGRVDPFDGHGETVAGGALLANGVVAAVTCAILLARGDTAVRFSLPVPP